jgi:hypothetical protein
MNWWAGYNRFVGALKFTTLFNFGGNQILCTAAQNS